MPLPLLLLLPLLGPGSSLQLGKTWEDGPKEAPGTLLARDQRQEDMDDVDTYDDYGYGTDPPEMLENSTGTVSLSPKRHTLMGTLGQQDSAEPSTPEPATGNSSGLDAGGAATGNLSTESATQGIPGTLGPLTEELATTIPSITEAPSTELVTMKPLSTGPAATEALTMQPAATEVLTRKSTVIVALSTKPAATEALTTEQADTTAPSVKPTTTETLSTDPTTPKALSTRPAATRNRTTALLVPSDPHRGTSMPVNSSEDFLTPWRNRRGPQSSGAPAPAGVPDYIPVKQCLLAILILALVATVFLVCTVVLAVRLSRKSHMYPVRNYSPTEMVCISSLLPDGDEGPTATANGSRPPKRVGLKEDHEGDDLTLHSFLP